MNRYLHLESLRGIAAFVVFLSHFRPTFYINVSSDFMNYLGITNVQHRAITENFLSLFYEGTLPVYVFWFMSAYVISIKLFDSRRNENNRYLIEASTKRYFRLAIPVFFSSLICFLLIKTNSIYNKELALHLGKGYQDDWLNHWFNFDPGIVHFLRTTIVEVFMPSNSNYNLALWTMNAELLGSFLCFGLYAVLGKNKLRFLIFICVCIFLVFAGLRDPSCFYYLVFVIGLMWSDADHSEDLNVLFKNKVRKILNSKITPWFLLVTGFTATIISDAYQPLSKNLYYFFTFPVKAIGFTLLINNSVILKRIFIIKPLTYLGKLSFSFYLVHIPVMFSLGIYLYLYGGIESQYKILIVFFALIIITLLFAYLFMKLVDEKAMRLSNKIGRYFSEKGN